MKKLLLFFLPACSLATVPQPEPTVVPTASPSPTPTPIPVPKLFMPTMVPVNGDVVMYLCEPYKPNTKVFIDKDILLGTMGSDILTGCMKLFYPGFKQSGLRQITVGEYTATLLVVDTKE